MLKDLSAIKAAGFTGFKTVNELWNNYAVIPDARGIYLIINPDCSKKTFLPKGVGGFFKDKNPNVAVSELTSHWIDSCHVLYIGKAGGNSSAATLRKRLKQYMEFGKGKSVGHYGGRLIWQLSHHSNLVVAWKTTPLADPRKEEETLIKDFHSHYGKLPFANLKF